MQYQTVAQKVAELNSKRTPGNNEWESYRTLSASESLPTNRVKSLWEQVEDASELLRLRKKFEKDPRREVEMVDINRPKDWETDGYKRVAELLKIRDKHKADPRWKKAPRVEGEPITLDEFIQMLLTPLKGALAVIAIFFCACLFAGSASAQQTNLFTNNSPNNPFYPTNSLNGGGYGVFVPLMWETMGTNSTNSYINGTNYQGQVATTNLNGNITNSGPYNGGYIYPVGAPLSLNVAFSLTSANSNACNAISTVVATVQQSVDGIDWVNLLTLTNTTGASTAAGTVFSSSTNVNIGAYSLFRLSQITDVQLPGTNNVFTNVTFGVACKRAL